jgi:threonine/homoserine/homoserine lactone efflux protein
MIEFIEAKIYLSFLLFVFVWMLSPGVGHLLMLSNGTKYGMPQSMLTALGDVSVNILQMLVAALGLGALIASIPWSLQALKWTGIIYLSYMAFQNLRSYFKKIQKKLGNSQKDLKSNLFMQGAIVTFTNAKAILFFSVAFPPFLSDKFPIIPQLIILGVCFVFVDLFFLTFYGFLGAYGFSKFTKNNQSFIDGFSGLMLLAAIALLLFNDMGQ